MNKHIMFYHIHHHDESVIYPTLFLPTRFAPRLKAGIVDGLMFIEESDPLGAVALAHVIRAV